MKLQLWESVLKWIKPMESENLKKSNMGGWNICYIWIYVSEVQIKWEKNALLAFIILHFYAHGIIVKGFI